MSSHRYRIRSPLQLHLLLLLLLLVVVLSLPATSAWTPSTTTTRNLLATYFSEKTHRFFNRQPAIAHQSTSAMCGWLKAHQTQFAQCVSQRGLANVLQDARALTIRHCRRQFSFDRWDCSKVQTKFMFRRVYRETAFVQAIAASALMFAVSKACSNGDLEQCFCAQKTRAATSTSAWHLVGCGDDLKTARNISRRFLLASRRAPANDTQRMRRQRLKRFVLAHNVRIGFEAIKAHRANVCICHGFSGSCTLKTCKKVITHDFAAIADTLKAKYKEAQNYRRRSERMVGARTNLLYLAESPNFCDATRGRRCKDPNHCATLCCGRGYNFTSDSVLNNTCICRFNNDSLQILCKPCETIEDYFICK